MIVTPLSVIAGGAGASVISAGGIVTGANPGAESKAIVVLPTTSSVANEAKEMVFPATMISEPPGESVCDPTMYSDREFSATTGGEL